MKLKDHPKIKINANSMGFRSPSEKIEINFDTFILKDVHDGIAGEPCLVLYGENKTNIFISADKKMLDFLKPKIQAAIGSTWKQIEELNIVSEDLNS